MDARVAPARITSPMRRPGDRRWWTRGRKLSDQAARRPGRRIGHEGECEARVRRRRDALNRSYGSTSRSRCSRRCTETSAWVDVLTGHVAVDDEGTGAVGRNEAGALLLAECGPDGCELGRALAVADHHVGDVALDPACGEVAREMGDTEDHMRGVVGIDEAQKVMSAVTGDVGQATPGIQCSGDHCAEEDLVDAVREFVCVALIEGGLHEIGEQRSA